MNKTLFIGCDNLIRIGPVVDQQTGNYVNDGSAAFAITDPADGVSLLQGVSLAYDGSDGMYSGVFTSTQLGLVMQAYGFCPTTRNIDQVSATITFTSGSYHDARVIKYDVQIRGAL